MATTPRIIPVLDLKAGRAVRAEAGRRAHYPPVRSARLGGPDPIGLARAFRGLLGTAELYLADLGAIEGAPPALGLLRALADEGASTWVDPGLRGPEGAAALLASGASVLVAGLETLRGPLALADLVAEVGPDRVAFSLDLKAGRPLGDPASWGSADPRDIARGAIRAGARTIIVLDLARVGTGGGVGTLPLLRSLREDHPGVDLIAGGGVSGPDDLAALGEAGAGAVLVGSALLDGRIGRPDPEAVSPDSGVGRGPRAR